MTANGQNLSSVSMNGAATGPNGNTLPENGILTREYPLNNGTISMESGFASTLQRTWATDGSGNVSSYSRRASVGNFTCWPATCGLELTSTEFDFDPAVEFKPNDLLTGAVKPTSEVKISVTETVDNNGTQTTQTVQYGAGAGDPSIRRRYYQKNRGGYLTKVDLTATPAEGAFHNICGTVSRGIIRNENAVNVLYFWAERTLLPKVTA